ncbi:MAG: hypothetical protein AAF611_01170 [Bacteroidota bacterium]
MPTILFKKKIITLLSYIFLTTFFSCKPPTCPKVEQEIHTFGNVAYFSMFECGAMEPLFDLDITLDVTTNPYDSLDTKKYIHIPKENIDFKKYKDYNYEIITDRVFDGDVIRLIIYISPGNHVLYEGTKFIPKENQNNGFVSASFSAAGFLISLSYEIYIRETDGKVTEVLIYSEDSNKRVLESFKNYTGGFNKKYSDKFSIKQRSN